MTKCMLFPTELERFASSWQSCTTLECTIDIRRAVLGARSTSDVFAELTSQSCSLSQKLCRVRQMDLASRIARNRGNRHRPNAQSSHFGARFTARSRFTLNALRPDKYHPVPSSAFNTLDEIPARLNAIAPGPCSRPTSPRLLDPLLGLLRSASQNLTETVMPFDAVPLTASSTSIPGITFGTGARFDWTTDPLRKRAKRADSPDGCDQEASGGLPLGPRTRRRISVMLWWTR